MKRSVARFAGSIFQLKKIKISMWKLQNVKKMALRKRGKSYQIINIDLSLGHVHLPKSHGYKRWVVAQFRLARLLLPKSKWSLVYTNSFIKYVNITTVNYRWIIGSPF